MESCVLPSPGEIRIFTGSGFGFRNRRRPWTSRRRRVFFKKLFCVAHFPLFGISFTCLNVHFEVAWVVFANVAVNRNLTNWEVGIWTIYIYKNNEINLDKSNAKTYCQDFLRNLRNSWHCFPRVPDGHLHFPDFRHLPPFSQGGSQIPKRNRKYIFTQKWCFYIFVFSCFCFKVKNVILHFFLFSYFTFLM